MGSDKKIKVHGPSAGTFWCMGWLFTIGFVKLGFWKAVLGLLIWPWYLGDALHAARAVGTAAGADTGT
jgi:hypothetical protein